MVVSKIRQVLDCGSPLPLLVGKSFVPKRQLTGAVQDAVALQLIPNTIRPFVGRRTDERTEYWSTKTHFPPLQDSITPMSLFLTPCPLGGRASARYILPV